METMEFYYDYNSAILTTKSRNLLDRVAVVLNQYPDWKLLVRSYTDSRGSDAYNKDLSALRCYAVIEYLVKKGVVSSRLYYENIGKDPEDPCGKGVPCTDEQYMHSRRTMLKIIHK
jgi:outer membrane protein OmpA-like peptidoglycan-associated protein